MLWSYARILPAHRVTARSQPYRYATRLGAPRLTFTRSAGKPSLMQSAVARRIATRIRVATRAAGLSQQQVADAIHISQSALSRRYLGYVEFRATELDMIAATLGITADDLLGEDRIA